MRALNQLARHMALVAALLTCAAVAHAQSTPDSAKKAATVPAYRFRILGVLEAAGGEPVEDAEVSNILSGMSAKTTKTGTVSLYFLPEGVSMVRIRKVGYATQTLAVEIGPNATTPITVVFERAQQLPAVVTTDSAPRWISPALTGFEERRKQGLGYFIPSDVLRKEENRPLGNVLRARVPGIDVWTGRLPRDKTTKTVLRSARPEWKGYCYPDVYLDGVLVTDTPADLSQYSTMDIGAIEFHTTATLPIQFNHSSSLCGALLLWSRER